MTEMGDPREHIATRLEITKTHADLNAYYKNTTLAMRLPRDENGAFAPEDALAIIANLPEILTRLLNEAFVRLEAKTLDMEIEQFLSDDDSGEKQ